MTVYIIGCVVALLLSLSILTLAVRIEHIVYKQDIIGSMWVMVFASLLSWVTVFILIVIMVFA